MKTFVIFVKVVLILTLVGFYVLSIGGCFAMTTEAAVRYGAVVGVPMLIIEIALVTIVYDLCKNEVFDMVKD